MRKTMIPVVTILAALTAAPSVVGSKPTLQSVPVVEDGLFNVSVADKIRRECGDISGRYLKARAVLSDLYEIARGEGYTDEEIEAYVSSEEQKNRMRAKRDAYLVGQGVVKSNPASYCAAGRAEIDKSSQIGALLRVR